MEKAARATKKQRELLAFIDAFIKGNNYGPSYREIMRALGYKSVSTVAVHIDGLIAAGYLRKRNNSARSIEVLRLTSSEKPLNEHEEWLRGVVGRKLAGETSKADALALRRALDVLGIKQPETPQPADDTY